MSRFDRDIACRERAQLAATLVELAVDEQQARAGMLRVDPWKFTKFTG